MSEDRKRSTDRPAEVPDGRRVLPAGLAELPPGPQLVAAIASVDRRQCSRYELTELLKARRRLIGWLQAECLADANARTYASSRSRAEPVEEDAPPF